jgi:hypothetical protein
MQSITRFEVTSKADAFQAANPGQAAGLPG